MFDFFDIGNLGFEDVALAGAVLTGDDDLSPYRDLDLEALNRELYEGPSSTSTMPKKKRPKTGTRKSLKNINPLYREVQNVALNPSTGAAKPNIMNLTGEGLTALSSRYNTAAEPFVRGAQDLAYKYIPGKAGGISQTATRMAGSPIFRNTMRYLPAVGAVGGVLGAADVLAGPDSFGNKAMDATAMTIGGILGSVGGPLGTAAGAGGGKMVSDSLQWLFGDKKTAEQRQMQQALLGLQGGNY